MHVLSKTLVVAIVGLTAGVSTAQAAKGVKKNGDHWHHGVVVAVEHDKGGSGSITIKTHHHKKKKAGTTPTVKGTKHKHEHKFAVSPGTKFTTVHHKVHKPASFSAVHKGEHVHILSKGHVAEKVAIHHHHHKKKPKKSVKK
jgi:hypothetical protein